MADKEDPVATRSSSPKLYYIKEARVKSVPQELSASQDLMTTFNLLPLYNRYVKQRLENNELASPIEPTYFPYINDLPGKNVIRPGNYIRTLLETPEKSYGPIHAFSSSTIRDSFSLRPGPVPGFDPSVLGTEEDGVRSARHVQTVAPEAYKQGSSVPGSGQLHGASGYDATGVLMPSLESPAHSSGHHHHSHHHHSHSKSSTSSPHVDKAERGEDGEREHRHKKKKKKRKHEHDHEHSHHDADSEHRKKKKRKKEREDQAIDVDVVGAV
ncbi:hypothetical protein MVEG_07427 [Podila verticillata NRRL 6337]|nr:hypothetical protein MVEG_07427 [Podila verticillata NRRL 6337]